MIWYCKRQDMYCVLFPSFWFYKHLAYIQHLLEQIWSNPIRHVTTEVADLGYYTSISKQVSNCNGVALDILKDHKF